MGNKKAEVKPSKPKRYRLLVPRPDGTGFDFVEATPEQAYAYANGNPAWRNAKAAPDAKDG